MCPDSFADPDMALRFGNLGPGHKEPDLQPLDDFQLDIDLEEDDSISSGDEGTSSEPSTPVASDTESDGFGLADDTHLSDSSSEDEESDQGDLDAYERAYDHGDDD